MGVNASTCRLKPFFRGRGLDRRTAFSDEDMCGRQPMPGWLPPPVLRGRSPRAGSGRKGGEVVFPFFALPFFRRSRVHRRRQTAALQDPRYLGFGHPMIFSPHGILGRPLWTTASCKRHQWPSQPKPRYRRPCSVFDSPLVCITAPAARPEGCLPLDDSRLPAIEPSSSRPQASGSFKKLAATWTA